MSTSSRNTHLLFRYGQCLNDGCSKCKSKEIQEIPARKDFVCQECGKELREVQRPRSWWEKYGKVTSAAVAAVVVIGGGVTWLATSGSDSEKPVQENVAAPDSSVITSPDTTEIQPAEKTQEETNKSASDKVVEAPTSTSTPAQAVSKQTTPAKKAPTPVANGANLKCGKY